MKIGQLGRVVTGKTPPTKRTELYGDKYPFITPTGIREESYVAQPVKFLSEDGYDFQSRYALPEKAVCYTCIASIGKICLTTEPSFTNQQINSIIVDHGEYDYRFIYHLLRHETERIKALASGTAAPIINKSIFSDIELCVPPLLIQTKIASVLFAYDDLIENNLRCVKILEEMAQALFREWFVNFRFPGHEKSRLVESPVGTIPKGWKVAAVSEAVCINPKTVVRKDVERPYVAMSGLSSNSMVITETATRTSRSGTKFRNKDTLMARITPSIEHGKTGFAQFLPSDSDIAIGSTEFIVLRSHSLNPYYVYFLARTEDLRQHAIKSMTGASGRQRVQTACFDEYHLAHPDEHTLDTFAHAVAPIFRRVHVLWTHCRLLRQTRDLLLPRLISGELDVSDLDIDIGKGRA